MKKIYLLILYFLPSIWVGAQEPETIAQPQNIIGRIINAAGEITKEYPASFFYAPNGKLDGFSFPEYGLSSTYNYKNDFLTEILTSHQGAWPFFDEALRYTYENGRVKLESHTWSDMNSNEYITYTYYDNGRLKRKDYASYHPEDVNSCSQFEYENEGKTRIETYSTQGFKGSDIVLTPKYRTVCQYDDDYRLLSAQTDNYNENGEVTKTRRTLYTFAPNGNLESELSQTLVIEFLNFHWENNTIHEYLYNDQDILIEQQYGTWSAEQEDWNITKKTVHEYAADNKTYTVSFFKKSGNEWVRDVFAYQELFFGLELKQQQEALGYFVYEDLLGSTQVNQFEFEMNDTPMPTYNATTEEKTLLNVYPNPGKSTITINAPIENAVIRFYNLQGCLLIAKPFDFNTTIEIGNWIPGIYLWEIWNGNQKAGQGKWVKQ